MRITILFLLLIAALSTQVKAQTTDDISGGGVIVLRER